MASDSLPHVAVKKATNLVRDANLAISVGFIPILGLIFILRLTQWYLLPQQFPALMTTTTGEHAKLSGDFRSALHRLWFAVLLWPLVILFIIGYFFATS